MLRKVFDRLADASIFFSFDRTGYERHARDFDPAALEVDGSGRRILVTGANSGLGRAAAFALAHRRAEVWLLCRNRERGEQALDDLRFSSRNPDLRLELVDVSSLRSVREFARRLGARPVDALVHNAGVLPAERQWTDDGLELTWATNVVGPFLLTALLLPNLRRAAEQNGEARVINVSSGGMYTQKIDLDGPSQTPDQASELAEFDGVVTYAQTKRAEVILTELWAERLAGTGVAVNSMHPGWADTPAVREALPRFWQLTRDRLRTPRQGADTMVWLALSPEARGESGKFFFDRRAVSTYLLPHTRETEEERAALWDLCRRRAELPSFAFETPTTETVPSPPHGQKDEP